MFWLVVLIGGLFVGFISVLLLRLSRLSRLRQTVAGRRHSVSQRPAVSKPPTGQRKSRSKS